VHSPERPLNSTEIDGLQRRIRTLEVENARLKASVEVGTERRKEGETALADSEERALFDAIDEGFCIIEFLHGPLSDYLHIEANPAYELHAGHLPFIRWRPSWPPWGWA
jgi:hypothetical protein